MNAHLFWPTSDEEVVFQNFQNSKKYFEKRIDKMQVKRVKKPCSKRKDESGEKG